MDTRGDLSLLPMITSKTMSTVLSILNRLIPNKQIQFFQISDKVNIWTRDIMRNVFNTYSDQFNSPTDYVNHSSFESKTFLHGLLVVEDKLSMARTRVARSLFR